jgi:hypothetical protein
MEFLHCVDPIAEEFKGVVRSELAKLAIPERPALVEIGRSSAAAQVDRLVTGSCCEILEAPV